MNRMLGFLALIGILVGMILFVNLHDKKVNANDEMLVMLRSVRTGHVVRFNDGSVQVVVQSDGKLVLYNGSERTTWNPKFLAAKINKVAGPSDSDYRFLCVSYAMQDAGIDLTN